MALVWRANVSSLVIGIILTFLNGASGQILTSGIKPADQLLADYLASAEDMSLEFCARLEGEFTRVRGNQESSGNVYVITAESQKAKMKYFAFGEELLSEGTEVLWEERFRYRNQDLYKISRGFHVSASADAIQKDVEGNPIRRNTLYGETFNPYALIIYVDNLIIRRDVTFNRVGPAYLKAEFVRSVVDEKTGDVTGDFLFEKRLSMAQITFGSSCGFKPVNASFFNFDNKLDKASSTAYATTRTKWAKSGKNWLPVNISLRKKDPLSGGRSEVDLNIDWADPSLLDENRMSYERLLVKGTAIDWQKPFLNIIRNSKAR